MKLRFVSVISVLACMLLAFAPASLAQSQQDNTLRWPGTPQIGPQGGPPPVPQTQYYYLVGTQQKGPLPTAQILNLIAGGTIKRTTLVWTTGMGDWAEAQSRPDLAAGFKDTPPARSDWTTLMLGKWQFVRTDLGLPMEFNMHFKGDGLYSGIARVRMGQVSGTPTVDAPVAYSGTWRTTNIDPKKFHLYWTEGMVPKSAVLQYVNDNTLLSEVDNIYFRRQIER